jgi:hypothetical protein
VLEAKLPDMKEAQIELTVEDNTLTLLPRLLFREIGGGVPPGQYSDQERRITMTIVRWDSYGRSPVLADDFAARTDTEGRQSRRQPIGKSSEKEKEADRKDVKSALVYPRIPRGTAM